MEINKDAIDSIFVELLDTGFKITPIIEEYIVYEDKKV